MKLELTTIQETPIDALQQIQNAGRALLTALVEARRSNTESDKLYWLNKAKEFSNYLERIGEYK